MAAILWSVLYAHHGIAKTLETIFSFIVIQFFGVGLIISTALWYASPFPCLLIVGAAQIDSFRTNSINRALSNKYLTHASHTHATDQKVEWYASLLLWCPRHFTDHNALSLFRPYAFDVHANSFFPLFLTLYVAQLVLAPVVTRSNWVCLWVGNTLYLAAVRLPAY